jgi:4-amino-4-deoxy-L-arabinose transferase-like glycosyltransferase
MLKEAEEWLKENPYYVALGFVLILGVSLRLWQLGEAGLWLDEAWHTWAAKHFINGNGFGDSINAIGTYKRALYTTTLPILASFIVFGISEFSARLPSALVGTGVIYVGFLLGREIFDRDMGILFASVLALDTFILTWSREARMYIHLQLLFLLAIFLLLKWSDNDFELKNRYLAGLVITGLLGIKTHQAFLAFGPIAAVFIVTSIIEKLRSEELEFVDFTIHIFIGTLGLLTGGAYLFVNGIPGFLLGQTLPWYGGGKTPSFYWHLLKNRYSILFPLLWIGSGLIATKSIKNPKKSIPLLAFWIPFITHTYLIAMKTPRYIFYFYPFFLLLMIYPIWKSLKISFTRVNLDKITKISLIIIIGVLMINSLLGSVNFVESNPHGTMENRPNYKNVEEYLSERVAENDTIISSTPTLLGWYWNEEIDYIITPIRLEKKAGKIYDPRTGLEGINSTKKVNEIIEQEKGYFVMDHRFRWYVKNDIQEIVRSKTNLTNKKWKDIRIYKFKED